MRAVICMVIVCAVVSSVQTAQGGHDGRQIAHNAVSAAVMTVSPTGDDVTCRRGNLGMPCATLNRAYAIARCGDVIEVSAGSYGKQAISDTPRTCRDPVVIRAASGPRPVILKIQLGTLGEQWSYSTDGPDDLTLSGFKLTWGIQIWSNSRNVIVERMDGGSFLIGGNGVAEGPSGITLRDSDWGPCTPSGTFQGQFSGCRHYYEEDERSGQPRLFAGARNVVIERNVFHDMVIDYPDAHWECIWVAGGNNITFRANRFYNCQTNAIAMGDDGNDANTRGTWIFENNWCGRVPSINGCFKFGGLPYAATLIFRFNSFGTDASIQDEEDGDAQGRVVVTSNILTREGCVRGALYSRNLFTTRRGCGSTDRMSIFGYRYDGERLVPDGRSAQAVRAAFSAVAVRKLRSLRLMARELARTQKSPPGGWNVETLSMIVTDPVYRGQRLGIKSRHPALVTPRTWRAAQRSVAVLRR